ncbi:hypothetical protein SERLADRAFT_413323 [Serpula lacrymans var. lacrymans S7.9]|uniref:Uncharacterized protein n=1 Tax=Serpula lacrymans var. lacrymans (strain S7.9) TaxID=578457 RepID=F8NKE7_SERL9|nr:uncharacterized protein SERLADRAFT_413323 [Serpula lacrymans var. lacrymans S7.9]EGO28413.1 hypothetical protein SERLADRAFT_413323 [Serpula lacrymans var. lacrymans S7.9]
MRVKDILSVIPIPANIKLLVVFQVQAFTINLNAANLLASITQQGNLSDIQGFTVLTSDDLVFCDHVPSTVSTSSCNVIWDGVPVDDNEMTDVNATPMGSPAMADATTSVNMSSTSTSSSPSSTPSPSASKMETTSALTTSHASTSKSTVTVTVTASTKSAESAKPSSDQLDVSASETKVTVVTHSSAPTSSSTGKADEQDYVVRRSRVVSRRADRSYQPRDTSIEAIEVNGTVSVIVNGLGWNNQPAVLDRQCLWALTWPVQVLRNTKREDITFIAFQFWVLGMSFVALLNESVPHTFASLLTHMLATGWAGIQLYNTAEFHSEFERLTTNGACNPIDLIPNYWSARAAAEIPSLAFNAAGLVTSAVLSWRLAKLYGWQTFKRVGASITISRVYKIVLTLSIVIQLSLFFMVVSVALWIDQLWNGSIGKLATSSVYRPILIITLILMIPWLTTGWFAVRRELKIPMLIFLFLSFAYLVGWSAMFASTTFRWTFLQWRFFALITTASVFLTFVSFVLGVMGRVNFGKGLVRYLNAEEPLPGDTFTYVSPTGKDIEKSPFPFSERTVPTFSVAFGSGGAEAPLPSQMFAPRPFSLRLSGSVRSSQAELLPQGQRQSQGQNESYPPLYAEDAALPAPAAAFSRASPSRSSFRSLARHGSQLSVQSSVSSDSSNSSYGHLNGRRWVIE